MEVSIDTEGNRAVVYAGNYLNKLSGEKIEHLCRQQLAAGCTEIEVNFSQTELVNSIGISILLGLIDSAADRNAKVVFSDMNENTIELFDLLGLTKHVSVAA